MQHSFGNWWQRGSVWLGLSVNAHSMTLVEWRPMQAPIAPLQRWAQETWALGPSIAPDPWEDPTRLGLAVQALAQRAGLRCRRLAMGVAADRVVQQRMPVEPGLPARDVRAQVNWSASQALGLAWHEVAFDYRLVPEDVTGSAALDAPRTVDWLACPMRLVQAAQLMSRSAHLRLQFLGVEPVPMALTQAATAAGPAQLQVACEMARQGAQT